MNMLRCFDKNNRFMSHPRPGGPRTSLTLQSHTQEILCKASNSGSKGRTITTRIQSLSHALS